MRETDQNVSLDVMDLSINELLLRLQTCDENCQVEAKEARNTLGKSALETISAFSNEPDLGGGYLVLGVKRLEEGYKITGVQNPDKIQCELANICMQNFNIRISPEIHVEQVEGKTLIVAFIPEAPPHFKPFYIKKLGRDRGAYKRIGSADFQYTDYELNLLYQLCSNIPYEKEIFSDATWEDIEPDAILSYPRKCHS